LHQLILLLIELAVDRSQHLICVGTGDIRRQRPTECHLEAFFAVQIPLLHFAVEALARKVGLLLSSFGHQDKKFVSALAKDDVAATKHRFQYPGKLCKNRIPLE